jgi:hypothetical protein
VGVGVVERVMGWVLWYDGGLWVVVSRQGIS